MEHMKLAKRDKRRHSGVRCWVVIASLALAITFAFVVVTLWLGLSAVSMSRNTTPASIIDPFFDPDIVEAVLPARKSSNLNTPPPTPTPASQPAAVKRRKGQVEKVRVDPVNGKISVDGEVTTVPSRPRLTTMTSTTSTTPSSTPSAPSSEKIIPTSENLYTPHPIQETPTTGDTVAVGRVEPDHVIGELTEEDVLYPKLDPSIEGMFKEVLESGVPASTTVTPLPRINYPPPKPAEHPPPIWSPQDTWSSDPLPPRRAPLMEPRHPALQEEDLLAEESTEWQTQSDPSQDLEQPYSYDGIKSEEAENPVMSFIYSRLQSVHEWLVASKAGRDWQDMVTAVNESLYRADPGVALRKLKDMYYNTSVEPDVPLASLVYPTDPAELNNSSSLVSFGLLAFDLLLLRNLQLLAKGEDGLAGERAEMLLQDPEVRALGALFLPPQEVRRQLSDDPSQRDLSQLFRSDSHATPTAEAGAEAGTASSEDPGEEITLSAILQEATSFLTSALRAVLNLGRAYRASVASARSVHTPTDALSTSPRRRSPLDCLWTLYCRSLDKTAKLSGPYGFLAKLNGLGLRLLLGAVPVEDALDLLVRETTGGWGQLDCGKLFPRCSPEDAVPVALNTAMGRAPNS